MAAFSQSLEEVGLGFNNRDMLITDLAATVTFVELCEEVRTMCSVAKQQPITLKWIDDEEKLNSVKHYRAMHPPMLLAHVTYNIWSLGSGGLTMNSSCQLELIYVCSKHQHYE
ncbi:hypothetical protein PAMP_012737 [Pampus punctatissimus]